MARGNKEREQGQKTKQALQDGDMGDRDMSGVLTGKELGRTNARGEQTVSPEELARIVNLKVEGFSTIADSNVGDDTPGEKQQEHEDPKLEELINQMQLPGSEKKEKEESPMANTDSGSMLKELEGLRSLKHDSDAARTKRMEQLQTVPQFLAFLDKEIFPDMKTAEEDGDNDRVLELRAIIDRTLAKNPRVKTELDKREAERQDAASKLQDDAEKAARQDRNAEMSDLYADLPDDPDANPYPDGTPRKLNSPTAALEATQKKGGSALLVVRIPKDTLVPTGKGGYVKLDHDSAVQLAITVDKTEGTGDKLRVFRQAKVVKQVGGLHYDEVKAHPDAQPGVFSVIPPFFMRREEQDRRNDPFDALKEGIYIPHNREFRARKQDEAFVSAAADANLTATQLLIESAVGSMMAEANWVFRAQDKREYPRHLEVVLQRDEKDGPVHVLAWGPPPADRFAPRLGSLQPRKKDGKIVVIPLEVTARVEKQDEGEPKAYIRFETQDKTLMNREDDQAKNVRAALWDLNMCMRQALLNEYAASAETEATEETSEDMKSEENEAEVMEQLEAGPTEEESPAEEQTTEQIATKRRSRATAGKGK